MKIVWDGSTIVPWYVNTHHERFVLTDSPTANDSTAKTTRVLDLKAGGGGS